MGLKNNYCTEMCSGSEAGSYLRLIDLCITQLTLVRPAPMMTKDASEKNGEPSADEMDPSSD